MIAWLGCVNFGLMLFLIRRTDVVFEYMRLCGYRNPAYEKRRDSEEGLHLLDYLHEKKDDWWTALLACPFCLGFWLTIPVTLTSGRPPIWFGVYYIAILTVYLVLAAIQAALRKL